MDKSEWLSFNTILNYGSLRYDLSRLIFLNSRDLQESPVFFEVVELFVFETNDCPLSPSETFPNTKDGNDKLSVVYPLGKATY